MKFNFQDVNHYETIFICDTPLAEYSYTKGKNSVRINRCMIFDRIVGSKFELVCGHLIK